MSGLLLSRLSNNLKIKFNPDNFFLSKHTLIEDALSVGRSGIEVSAADWLGIPCFEQSAT